jgi:hypothetical protein
MDIIKIRFDSLYKDIFYKDITDYLKEYADDDIEFWVEETNKSYTKMLYANTKSRIKEVINHYKRNLPLERNFSECFYILCYYSSFWSEEGFKKILNEVIESTKKDLIIKDNTIIRKGFIIEII